MQIKSKKRCLSLAVVALLALALCVAPLASAEGEATHTVKWGQTLGWIAWMYDTTCSELMAANDLSNANYIYTGQVLTIPGQAESATVTHTVAAGESLLPIAAKYGVSIWDITRRNGMWNIDMIFVGQELEIPTSEQVVEAEETVTEDAAEAGDATMPVVQEAILITSPAQGDEVSSPLTVQGWGSAFENTLAVDILDADGTVIGQGYAMIDAEIGQTGPFTGTIGFEGPATAELGRVAVYSVSARDGAIEHLSSVTVDLQP